MKQLDDALAAVPTQGPTLTGARGKRCRRHEWVRDRIDYDTGLAADYISCAHCGKPRDEQRSRRGKSARRLGGDQERRIERTYGPRKVGEFGDVIDHVGRTWKWQSKATRAKPPAWLARISEPVEFERLPAYLTDPLHRMDGVFNELLPVLIRSFVRVGVPTRDWLVVRGRDVGRGGYVVMSGSAWLDLYGLDGRET